MWTTINHTNMQKNHTNMQKIMLLVLRQYNVDQWVKWSWTQVTHLT
jgi:hypothetical protein